MITGTPSQGKLKTQVTKTCDSAGLQDCFMIEKDADGALIAANWYID